MGQQDLSAFLIQSQPAHYHEADRGPSGTPDQGLDSCHQFLNPKWLSQIVIGSQLEPIHFVSPGIPRRKNEYGRLIFLRPPIPQDVKPRPIRQAQIEDDRIVRGPRSQSAPLLPSRGMINGETGLPEFPG